MPQINLVWNDSDSRLQTYQLSLLASDLDKKTNIGRDQARCDLWLAHNTVSRVHAEISFKAEWQRFYLRNLAVNNPVRVDGGLLVDGEVSLYEGSMIQLGQLLLQVSDIVTDELSAHTHGHSFGQPSHGAAPANSVPAVPSIPPVPPIPPVHRHEPSQTTPTSGQSGPNAQPQNAAPKLMCPKCQTLQVLSLRNSNCPVCGHFLADASSRYFF